MSLLLSFEALHLTMYFCLGCDDHFQRYHFETKAVRKAPEAMKLEYNSTNIPHDETLYVYSTQYAQYRRQAKKVCTLK